MVRWSWVSFQCRSVPLIWIIVEQGPIALAVGAGRVVWSFVSRLSLLFSFSISGSRNCQKSVYTPALALPKHVWYFL